VVLICFYFHDQTVFHKSGCFFANLVRTDALLTASF